MCERIAAVVTRAPRVRPWFTASFRAALRRSMPPRRRAPRERSAAGAV
jgi:hypothetical protein